MTTDEDKREFEFIEHPVSPNKHNSSSTSIVKMWVLLEGSPRATKLTADISKVKDLDDFVPVLQREYEKELKNTRPQNIIFLDNNNIPYRPGTELCTLTRNNTDETPLIVRYPISSANLKVTLAYWPDNNQSEHDLAHTSGAFSQLKEIAKEEFKLLEETEIYFVNDETEIMETEIMETKIMDAYNFNILLTQTELDDNNNYVLRLKTMEKDKKPFIHWDFNSVFKDILGEPNVTSISNIKRMHMTEFPPLDKPFTEEELAAFTGDLKSSIISLKKEFNNEQKSCIYINAFLKAAVVYIHKNISKSVWLNVESYLDGKYGYGPVDYLVMFDRIMTITCVAKKEDMEQGVAQVIVQIRSAIEQMMKLLNNKRKLNQMELKPLIFGIVTTGNLWRFVRWTGSLEEPMIHISETYICDFDKNMDNEIEVLILITQIIKYQVQEFTNYNIDSDHLPKCLCTGD